MIRGTLRFDVPTILAKERASLQLARMLHVNNKFCTTVKTFFCEQENLISTRFLFTKFTSLYNYNKINWQALSLEFSLFPCYIQDLKGKQKQLNSHSYMF